MKMKDMARSFNFSELESALEDAAVMLKTSQARDDVVSTIHNMRFSLGVLSQHSGDSSDPKVAEALVHLLNALVGVDKIIHVEHETLPSSTLRAFENISRASGYLIGALQMTVIDGGDDSGNEVE